jgi:hypothetical protein
LIDPSDKYTLRNICESLITHQLIDHLIDRIKHRLYKEFDASHISDSETHYLIKAKMQALILIKKEIERLAKEKIH